jgi:CDP-4-dehydro-6-deoxyglucose reductase
MTSFSVLIEPLGRTILADADRPVLEAALAAGLNLPHSCKSGHCTSCRAQLRAGAIAYPGDRRPAGLLAHEAEAGRVLLCQARPRSDLVVEVRTVGRRGDVLVTRENPGAAGAVGDPTGDVTGDATRADTVRDLAAALEIRRLPCRIDAKQPLAPDVMQVFLRLPAAESLAFLPGQYLDVLLEGGRRRSFSIASPPHDAARLELHVRRAPGGGFSDAVFEALPVGSLLKIEAPIGQFLYVPSAAPLLLIAGGTGFAPLKSIVRHVLEVERTTRPIHLYWGARAAIDVYEHETLRRWASEHPNLHYVPVLSAAGEDAPWRRGWVHEAAARDLGTALARHDVYVAGPPALVEAVRAGYPAQGVAPERIQFDSFDYAPR